MTEGETPRERAHHVADDIHEVDITTALEALRAGDAYRAGDHAAATIAKHEGIRVVLVALKAGGRMHEHRTEHPITVQGLQGRLELSVAGRAIQVMPNRLVGVAAGLPHQVSAAGEESAFLLTVGGPEADGG